MTKKPVVLVLHGPAGAGKDAVINQLRERTGIRRATSTTTRAPRAGERDRVDYYFVSREEFKRGVEAGEFCEWANVYGDLKGVRRTEVEGPLSRGEDLIIRTDVQGARSWREQLRGAVFVFIMADDPATLRRRLEERRSETEDTMEARKAGLEEELEDIPNNDFTVVNRQGHLEEAVDELQQILDSIRADEDREPPRLVLPDRAPVQTEHRAPSTEH